MSSIHTIAGWTIAIIALVMFCGRLHSLWLDHKERELERKYGIVPSWKRTEDNYDA